MRAVVFACGDPLRGDDGAARAALDVLVPAVRAAADVREVSELSVDDLLGLGPDDHLLVVDTVVGSEPGAVIRLDLDDLPVAAEPVRPRSGHELPLDQAIGMAVLLGGCARGTFLGIGGLDFGIGRPLSEAVRRGLPALRLAIEAELERLGSGVAAPVGGG